MNEVMQNMNNLENGLQIKNMTAVEAAQALKMLATMIKGPVALGIWEGSLTGKISGHTHDGEMIAVFNDTALVAPFGFRGDQEGEACAALFATAFSYADKIVDALAHAEARAVEAEAEAAKFRAFVKIKCEHEADAVCDRTAAEDRAVEAERQRDKLALALGNGANDCPYLTADDDDFCQTHKWCKAQNTEEYGFECEGQDILGCWLEYAAQKDGE